MAQGMSISETARNHMLAVFAQNLGGIEGAVEDIGESIDESTQAMLDAADLLAERMAANNQYMIDSGFKVCGGPNLLTERCFEKYDRPSTEMVIIDYTIPAESTAVAYETPITITETNQNITAACTIYWVEADPELIDIDNVTLSASAGSATVTIPARKGAHTGTIEVSIAICEHAVETNIYSQTGRWKRTNAPYIKNVSGANPSTPGVDPDVISEAIVELTGTNAVTDENGDVFNYAIAFTCSTPNSAYGNCERMMFNWGNFGAGDMPVHETGNIQQMEVGHTYTMSFLARITSGEKMLVKFGYDMEKHNSISAHCDWQEVSGSEWKRYYWTFVFEPTGNQYTDTTSSGVTKRVANWTKTVEFGISRKYAGTIQMCAFRLHEGEMWVAAPGRLMDPINALVDTMNVLKERIEELEEAVFPSGNSGSGESGSGNSGSSGSGNSGDPEPEEPGTEDPEPDEPPTEGE